MASWNLKYCSTQNTADESSPFFWTWQSNGKCREHCASAGTFAYMVLQYQNCWCSNYIPQAQNSISDCSTNCPGYDTENCGKTGQYYVYVELDGKPSGTAGASRPASSNLSPSSPSPARPNSSTAQTNPDASTVFRTVTSAEVVTITTSQSSKPPPTGTPSSLAPAETSIRTITDNGGIVKTETLLVTPTPIPIPQPATPGQPRSNTAAIVGGVAGGVVALALIVAGVLFFLWRRRRQQEPEAEGSESGVHRYASTMSKDGLLPEKGTKIPSPVATAFARRQSRNVDQDSISPLSASDRRNSSFRVDQRLNPSTIFVFENSSRASLGSLDDSRDYHRTLNVRNPDT